VRDRRILYATCFLRAVATQMLGILLGVYLPLAELGVAEVGTVVSAGLRGAAGAALLATLLVGAALKISYDLLLYRAFRSVKPPEEAG
jgi:hypothetical protein